MGNIIGLCLLGAGDAPAGFAKIVEGSATIDRNAQSAKGINSQRLVEPGIGTATLELSNVIGMLKAELIKCQAPSTGTAMTALDNYLLITDDGAFKLSQGAGHGLKVSLPQDPQGFVGLSCTMEFGKVEASALTIADVVSLTTAGHQKRHCQTKIDTVAAPINSCEIDTGLSIEPVANMAAVRTDLPSWEMTEYEPTFNCEIAEVVEAGDDFLAGETLTAKFVPHDITITMANGTAGENLLFTFTNYVYTKLPRTLQYNRERFKKYEFVPGTDATDIPLVIS